MTSTHPLAVKASLRLPVIHRIDAEVYDNTANDSVGNQFVFDLPNAGRNMVSTEAATRLEQRIAKMPKEK